VLVAASDSPVLYAAKLAKVTVDCRWEEVFRRYEPAIPQDPGRIYVMSNNSQIRKSMYGFRDPALGTPQVDKDDALPHVSLFECWLPC
jgi:hypothetical protein